MGELLRRYWMPIAGVSEFDEQPGQGRPLDGRRPGPLPGSERHLRPRRPALPASPRRPLLRLRRGVRHAVQLSRLAIRRERPLHRAALRGRRQSRRQLQSDKVRDQGLSGRDARPACCGPISGPQPAPLVPNWEPFTWKNGFVQIVFAEIPCNWLQCQENSIDPGALRVDAPQLERCGCTASSAPTRRAT